MDLEKETLILDELINFKIKEIPDNIKFWMVRTQKGYFFEEFIREGFIALGWNSIDDNTNFSESSREALRESVNEDFPNTKRPGLVINKCYNFIHEVHINDIIIVPSEKTARIAIVQAGEYYEDADKTLELEKETILLIDKSELAINQVKCPYKKRRHIKVLKIVEKDELNYHLLNAISSYHGINLLDDYATIILGHLYNVFTYKDDIFLVYNIRQTGAISPIALSSLLYGSAKYISNSVEENKLSTKVNLNSIGDVKFIIEKGWEIISNNGAITIGILIVIMGGSAVGIKCKGIPQFLKEILSLKVDKEIKTAELEGVKLNNLEKKIKIFQQMQSNNITIEMLERLGEAEKDIETLKITPIDLMEEADFKDAEINDIQIIQPSE